jgi:predicted amidophosphoribosyltransferase
VEIVARALELLGPARCAGCGGQGPLCRHCTRSVRPAPPGAVAPPARVVVAPWAYEGAARALVLDLKLRGNRAAAQPLAEAMSRAARRAGLAPEIVAWVPARRRDQRRRGLDHAHVLAALVAPGFGCALRPLLGRAAAGRDQASLSRAQRRRNLVGAFWSRRCRGRVLLVDDLVTTGATAGACAEALVAAGASSVDVLAACRAQLHGATAPGGAAGARPAQPSARSSRRASAACLGGFDQGTDRRPA